MNLESLNLVELNTQEVQEIDGGFIPLLIAIGGALYSTGYAVGYFVKH
ncbi:class IIb bacteriocin, lactobin A/cerein 7B family [Flavobacterium reichenbachii]|nr:class IIb bacteriocin, lactobin A/cerein 7B family [Flavobacterium reichenbachii]OXB17449.1 bacteriocin [Flavobacterium reichenbachii]